LDIVFLVLSPLEIGNQIEHLPDVGQVRHLFVSIRSTGIPDRHIFNPDEPAFRPYLNNLVRHMKNGYFSVRGKDNPGPDYCPAFCLKGLMLS